MALGAQPRVRRLGKVLTKNSSVKFICLTKKKVSGSMATSFLSASPLLSAPSYIIFTALSFLIRNSLSPTSLPCELQIPLTFYPVPSLLLLTLLACAHQRDPTPHLLTHSTSIHTHLQLSLSWAQVIDSHPICF